MGPIGLARFGNQISFPSSFSPPPSLSRDRAPPPDNFHTGSGVPKNYPGEEGGDFDDTNPCYTPLPTLNPHLCSYSWRLNRRGLALWFVRFWVEIVAIEQRRVLCWLFYDLLWLPGMGIRFFDLLWTSSFRFLGFTEVVSLLLWTIVGCDELWTLNSELWTCLSCFWTFWQWCIFWAFCELWAVGC